MKRFSDEPDKRIIYLIRHGEANIVNGEKLCLGSRLDAGLTEEGRRQARLLRGCLPPDVFSAVYCSRLKRSRETAEILSSGQTIRTLPGIEEMDTGAWEGLTFEEIRGRYPALYARRNKIHSVPPPGGESFETAAKRMQKALRRLLAKDSSEELAVIAHSGAVRALLCSLSGNGYHKNRDLPQPYCGITVLELNGDGVLHGERIGVPPDAAPEEAEVRELLELCAAPEDVRAHMKAVADLTLEMAERVSHKIHLDQKMLCAAAMLHDVCRGETAHEQKAAALLRKRGYLRAAEMIYYHHDAEEILARDFFSDEILLFLADKMIQGARRVSIEERFERSESRCKTKEAKAAHSKRYEQAVEARRRYAYL